MRFISFARHIIWLLPFSALAQHTYFDAQGLMGNKETTVITDPSITKRCLAQIEKRQEKLQIQQKLIALIERNRHLQKVTPTNKKSVSKRLDLSLQNIEREKRLIDLKVKNFEEDIIRKGCPGINLQ